MMRKNYYEILGVSINATDKEIKAGYYIKSKTYHPDLNGSDDAVGIMQDINEAYDVLSNPINKMQYDFILQNSQLDGISASGNFYNSIYIYAHNSGSSRETIDIFKTILNILRDNNARSKETTDAIVEGLRRITDIINIGLDELEKKRNNYNDYMKRKQEERELKEANSFTGKVKQVINKTFKRV